MCNKQVSIYWEQFFCCLRFFFWFWFSYGNFVVIVVVAYPSESFIANVWVCTAWPTVTKCSFEIIIIKELFFLNLNVMQLQLEAGKTSGNQYGIRQKKKDKKKKEKKTLKANTFLLLLPELLNVMHYLFWTLFIFSFLFSFETVFFFFILKFICT